MEVLIKIVQSYLFIYSKSIFQTTLNFKLLHYVYYMHLHYFFKICEMQEYLDQMCLEKNFFKVDIIFHLSLFHRKLSNNFMVHNILKEDLNFYVPSILLIFDNNFLLNFKIYCLFNPIIWMIQFTQE